MDEVDLRILRAMMSEEGLLYGGFEPRTSSSRVADQVGLDPSTVRARIRRWQDEGFLLGFRALPNPRLLGDEARVGSLRVADPREKPGAMEALALVDGIMEVVDYVGPWLGLGFLTRGEAVLRRRLQAIENVPGVVEVEPPLDLALPEPQVPLHRTDARMLLALLHDPDASTMALGEAAGVSPNTAGKHLAELVASRAVMSVPELDFGSFQGGTVVRTILVAAPDTAEASVRRALATVGSEPLSLVRPLAGGQERPSMILSYLIHLPSAALLDELDAAARGAPGVREVEILFPRGNRVLTAWAEEALEALVPSP